MVNEQEMTKELTLKGNIKEFNGTTYIYAEESVGYCVCYSVTKETSTFIFITNIYCCSCETIISGLEKTGDNICLYKRAWGV